MLYRSVWKLFAFNSCIVRYIFIIMGPKSTIIYPGLYLKNTFKMRGADSFFSGLGIEGIFLFLIDTSHFRVGFMYFLIFKHEAVPILYWSQKATPMFFSSYTIYIEGSYKIV